MPSGIRCKFSYSLHAKMVTEKEKTADSLNMNNNEAFEEDDEEEYESDIEFSIDGFIEMENFINTFTEQSFPDTIKKNEFRLKLNMKYGSEDIYIKAVPNFYVLPYFISDDIYRDYKYEEKFTVTRNGRIANEFYEFSINELYMNFSWDSLQLRVGNQIFAWGTADTLNPTSCFNPADTRELFYKSGDELNIGVPAVSSMIYLGDYTLELVFTPMHIPAITPSMENFWGYHYEMGPLTLLQDENSALNISPENFGYGARLAGSISGVDMAISAYHGPDKNPVLRPMETVPVPNDLLILVKPEYHVNTSFGFDISFKLWKFVIQGEIAYSPDKTGVVDQLNGTFSDMDFIWPFEVTKSHYISYATGFNFFWNSWRFTMEWNQSKYFKSGLMSSYLSGFLTFNINKSFFDDTLNMSITSTIDSGKPGFLVMSNAGYDFQNGITVSLAYSNIHSSEKDDNSITLFDLFQNNDIVIVEIKYEF